MTLKQRILRLNLGDGLSAPEISDRLKTYWDHYEHTKTCRAIVELVNDGFLVHRRETFAECSLSVFRQPKIWEQR